MHAQVLTVEWHEEGAPIYSVDCNPTSDLIATGGQDFRVLIWKLVGSTVEHVATLEEHLATVNCVRWSPCGSLLASATDGGSSYGAQLLVWALEGQTWRVRHRAQFPRDIYDIAWNPNGKEIVAVGTDSKARVFDIKTAKTVDEWATHTHYIQGVAWDPRGKMIASQGMDRMLVVRTLANKSLQRVKELAVEGGAQVSFLNEHASSYFRRLAFTPDGQFLICPCAQYTSPSGDAQKCTLVFSRSGLATNRPSVILPLASASIAVSCSPRLYKSERNLVDCEYACVFAVVTHNLVVVYSTQQQEPLCVVGDLHPTSFTDLSWSRCGTKIVLSSMEGFCSLIEFDELEVIEGQQAAPQPAAAPAQATINTLVARKKTS